MRNALMALVILGWLGGLWYGYVYVVSKTMKPSQPKNDPAVIRSLRQEQRQKIDDLKMRQKHLIEDRQRRLRDMQSR